MFKSPLAARNDAEDSATDTNKSDEQKKADAKKEEKKEEKQQEKKAEAKPAAPNVDIDLDGFEARAVVLPPKAGNYADLQAVKGKVLYRRRRAPARATRRTPSSSSISRSAKRRRCSTMPRRSK